MKKRNLSAKKKTHNFYLNHLKNPKIKKIFLEFKKNLEKYNTEKLCIAISGGSDSMALAFLAKSYSILNKKRYYYFIVDHKLRTGSTKEAKLVKNFLTNYGINPQILTLRKQKIISNIQSLARENRYNLIFNQCLKKKIKHVLTGHHKDDLYENFFIRLLRGSGLKGLSSFYNTKNKISRHKDVYILRPLLNIPKKDLLDITNKSFKFYIKDPSNEDEKYLRIKIRKLINKLTKEGLNSNKFNLTLENLYKSNETIEYFVKKNIYENSILVETNKKIILKTLFLDQPDEIVFRSLSELIHKIGIKKEYTRGSKILDLIKDIKFSKKFKKRSLSGCFFEKINNSIIIYREK